MKISPCAAHWLATFLFVSGLAAPGQAEEILFFGNSYTQGSGDVAVSRLGVPKLVEGIARAKGRKIATEMVVAGGKDWGFHLTQSGTVEVLAAKKWDWVVLQDFSTKPTHVGSVEEHLKNGEEFYRRIHAGSPGARIMLYETWARAAGNSLYGDKGFRDPEEMNEELHRGYAASRAGMEALEAGEQVMIAPVGPAFALSLKKHPELILHAVDKHHASARGSYLAALVLYATLFQDSPVGAVASFPGVEIDPAEALKLQQIAEEITVPLRRPKL